MNTHIVKKILFKLVFIFFILPATAQTPKQIVDSFFSDYQNEGVSTAIDNLYASNNWMKRNVDAITTLKSQMLGLNEDFVGKYYGYELIVEKKFSESYLLMSYLVKYDRQPIRFIFQFYKPNQHWKVHGFKYDGNIESEIEEASKLYYLNLED